MDSSISDDEMVLRREKEALAALRVVGAAGGFFLRKRSSDLQGEEGGKTGRELVQIIRGIVPEEVYLPGPYERHRTHQRCTRLAIEALRAAVGIRPAVWGYSLWGCFWGAGGRLVRDIGPHIRKKMEAVLAHSSQVAYKSYQQGILGKSNYEAVFWDTHQPQKETFVEAFLDMTGLLENRNLSLEDFMREDLEAFLKAYL